jgi:hypothetical protein
MRRFHLASALFPTAAPLLSKRKLWVIMMCLSPSGRLCVALGAAAGDGRSAVLENGTATKGAT